MADVKAQEQNPVLEKGDIYILYRPRVEADEAHGFEDVERFYMLLKPWRRELYRLIILGRKRLPDPGEHDRFWGFVWRVFTDRAALNRELGPREYATRTRGIRHVRPVRPAAEGIYALMRHGNHTHLAYATELPDPRAQHPAQGELCRGGAQSRKPAPRFPKELREKFAGRKFLPVDPPDFLDYEGAELVFIGAAEDPEAELGVAFEPDREDEHTADVFRDLELPREIARTPLFEGQWK